MFEEDEKKSRLYVYLTEAAVAVLLISIMLSSLYWSYLWILGIAFSFFIGIIPVRHYAKRTRMILSEKKNNKYKSSFYHDAENEYLDHFELLLDWFPHKNDVSFTKGKDRVSLTFNINLDKVTIEFENERAILKVKSIIDESIREYKYNDYYLFSDLINIMKSDILSIIKHEENMDIIE